METIIIGKQYEKNAKLENYNKKVLWYSTRQEVLIYKRGHGISIPTIEAPGYEEKIVSIAFEEDHLEPLLRVINCEFQYTTHNNKLVKQYLKYIREYYACLVEFDSAFQKQLQSFHTEKDTYFPVIMDIEEAIHYMDQMQQGNSIKSKKKALETLYCKVKEKGYERTNKTV